MFIAPFIADLRNPGRLFAGGNSLWRTDDAFTPNDDKKLTGPSWRSVKDSIGDPISAITISPVLSDIIWIGHQQGALFVTGNAQVQRPVWRRLAAANDQPGRLSRYVSSIFIGEDENDLVYVTYAAYREGAPGSNVWASANGGTNWSDIGGALPDAPVHKISRHPSKHNFLFVGTEIGLFASDDAGTNWSPTNEGPTNCPVYDLFWMGSRLVCTTHGRGMFQIDIA